MKKMKMIDIVVTILFIAILAVLFFFWKCKWDPIITIIAVAIILVTGFIAYKQHKKLDDLEDKK